MTSKARVLPFALAAISVQLAAQAPANLAAVAADPTNSAPNSGAGAAADEVDGRDRSTRGGDLSRGLRASPGRIFDRNVWDRCVSGTKSVQCDAKDGKRSSCCSRALPGARGIDGAVMESDGRCCRVS